MAGWLDKLTRKVIYSRMAFRPAQQVFEFASATGELDTDPDNYLNIYTGLMKKALIAGNCAEFIGYFNSSPFSADEMMRMNFGEGDKQETFWSYAIAYKAYDAVRFLLPKVENPNFTCGEGSRPILHKLVENHYFLPHHAIPASFHAVKIIGILAQDPRMDFNLRNKDDLSPAEVAAEGRIYFRYKYPGHYKEYKCRDEPESFRRDDTVAAPLVLKALKEAGADVEQAEARLNERSQKVLQEVSWRSVHYWAYIKSDPEARFTDIPRRQTACGEMLAYRGFLDGSISKEYNEKSNWQNQKGADVYSGR